MHVCSRWRNRGQLSVWTGGPRSEPPVPVAAEGRVPIRVVHEEPDSKVCATNSVYCRADGTCAKTVKYCKYWAIKDTDILKRHTLVHSTFNKFLSAFVTYWCANLCCGVLDAQAAGRTRAGALLRPARPQPQVQRVHLRQRLARRPAARALLPLYAFAQPHRSRALSLALALALLVHCTLRC